MYSMIVLEGGDCKAAKLRQTNHCSYGIPRYSTDRVKFCRAQLRYFTTMTMTTQNLPPQQGRTRPECGRKKRRAKTSPCFPQKMPASSHGDGGKQVKTWDRGAQSELRKEPRNLGEKMGYLIQSCSVLQWPTQNGGSRQPQATRTIEPIYGSLDRAGIRQHFSLEGRGATIRCERYAKAKPRPPRAEPPTFPHLLQ